MIVHVETAGPFQQNGFVVGCELDIQEPRRRADEARFECDAQAEIVAGRD